MSNLCKQCGKSITRGGYPIGRGSKAYACRFCAVRATGLTTTALRAAHGARIAGENYRRVIKRLKDKIAKYEQLEASRRERVEYLEDQIAEMLNDKATYEREMAKHGDK
jgi:Skp family chaperone for outer membrane proteins